MAQDIRWVRFRPAEVLEALSDYVARRRLLGGPGDPGLVQSVELSAEHEEVRALVHATKHSIPVSFELYADDVLDACIGFCLGNSIPLPTRGVKTLAFREGELALVIQRIQFGDPTVQTLTAASSGRPGKSFLDEAWKLPRVAELSDVRVIRFADGEVRQAVAAHFAGAIQQDSGMLKGLRLASEAEGVSARFLEASAAGRETVLVPRILLRVVVQFCKARKIALPLQGRKWLALLDGHLVMVIALPKVMVSAHLVRPRTAAP